jgi:hypothetical protein
LKSFIFVSLFITQRKIGAYIFDVIPEGNRSLGRLRRRWKDNIKTDIKEIGQSSVNWIYVAHHRDRRRGVVNTAMNLQLCRWTQYVSPKRWYLPNSPHEIITQTNINICHWKLCTEIIA